MIKTLEPALPSVSLELAAGSQLDSFGKFYALPRAVAESDGQYRSRLYRVCACSNRITIDTNDGCPSRQAAPDAYLAIGDARGVDAPKHVAPVNLVFAAPVNMLAGPKHIGLISEINWQAHS